MFDSGSMLLLILINSRYGFFAVLFHRISFTVSFCLCVLSVFSFFFFGLFA